MAVFPQSRNCCFLVPLQTGRQCFRDMLNDGTMLIKFENLGVYLITIFGLVNIAVSSSSFINQSDICIAQQTVGFLWAHFARLQQSICGLRSCVLTLGIVHIWVWTLQYQQSKHVLDNNL